MSRTSVKMKITNKNLFCVMFAISMLGFASAAASAEASANVALTSDYMFRGVSQTDEKGAIQGGFDFAADSGMYVGIWASNVNYGTDTSTEMDYIVGYSFETENEVGYDISLIYYDYEGDSEFDYQELAFSVSMGDMTLGLNYSKEYLGDNGPKFLYPYIDYSIPFENDLSLNLHLGLSDMSDPGLFEAGEDSYMDYSIGVAWTYEGVDFSAVYTDTTIDYLKAAEDRVVFTISKSL